MTKNNDSDMLEKIVADAHNICNQIMLCEAVEMEEDEVRLFLNCNHVDDDAVQDRYLELVRRYDEMTNSRTFDQFTVSAL